MNTNANRSLPSLLSSVRASWLLPGFGIGEALLFTLFLFPSVGAEPSAGMAYNAGLPSEWLVTVLLGTLVAVAMCPFANWLERSNRAQTCLYIASTVMQAVAVVLRLLASTSPVGSVACPVAACLGITPVSVLWMYHLTHVDVELSEKALLTTLATVSIGSAASLVLTALPLLFVLIPVGLACYMAYRRLGHVEALGVDEQETGGRIFTRGNSAILVGCAASFSIVSFAWEYSRRLFTAQDLTMGAVYAIGFAAAFCLFKIFLEIARRTGVESSSRWVFPIMAIGLTLTTFSGHLATIAAGLLLATGHGAFEMMIRNLLSRLRLAKLARL